MTKVIAVVSGGMDSVTALWRVADTSDDMPNNVQMVSFNYGQKHVKELAMAAWHANHFGIQHHIIDLTSITDLLESSALVSSSSEEVPEGHYAAENMKATVVPNRNMMMLAISSAIAVNFGAKFVLAGMHSGDHAIYPDCRPEFVDAFNKTVRTATEGFSDPGFKVYTPYINVPKDDIVREGHRLNLPYEKTWSCYKGLANHCGLCGTCVERKEAFELAGVVDPTVYDA